MPSPPTTPNAVVSRLLATTGVVFGATIAASSAASASHAMFDVETSNTIHARSPADESSDEPARGALRIDEDSATTLVVVVDATATDGPHSHCVEVTYAGTTFPASITGSITGPTVRLFATIVADREPSIARHVDVTIEEGTGGTLNDCSGFIGTATLVRDSSLAEMERDHSGVASGVGTFVPTSTDRTMSYRITTTASADAAIGDRGTRAAVEFGWAIHSG